MIAALTMVAAVALATPTLTLTSAQAPAAQAASAPAAAAAPQLDFPILPPAQAAADCGGLLGTPAFCVTAPLTEVGTLAETYIEKLNETGWLAADGDENRVIFVRRTGPGVCDGMQMVAFYDESKPVTPTTMGYLGFAAIPGNICVASPAQGPSSQ